MDPTQPNGTFIAQTQQQLIPTQIQHTFLDDNLQATLLQENVPPFEDSLHTTTASAEPTDSEEIVEHRIVDDRDPVSDLFEMDEEDEYEPENTEDFAEEEEEGKTKNTEEDIEEGEGDFVGSENEEDSNNKRLRKKNSTKDTNKSKKRKNRSSSSDNEHSEVPDASSFTEGLVTDQEDGASLPSSSSTSKPAKELSEVDKLLSRFKVKTKQSSAEKLEERKKADENASALVYSMKSARQSDEEAVKDKKIATAKLKLLPAVKEACTKVYMQNSLIQQGFLSEASHWIKPLPDRSLPNITIRTAILQVLDLLPVKAKADDDDSKEEDLERGGIDVDDLKSSHIGRFVKILSVHPKETAENKRNANNLIEKWSRLLLRGNADREGPSQEELLQQRLKRRKLEQPDTPTKEALKPGDPGFIYRARVPKREGFDFVVNAKDKLSGTRNVQSVPNQNLMRILNKSKGTKK